MKNYQSRKSITMTLNEKSVTNRKRIKKYWKRLGLVCVYLAFSLLCSNGTCNKLPENPITKASLIRPRNGAHFTNPDSLIFEWSIDKDQSANVDSFQIEIASENDTISTGEFMNPIVSIVSETPTFLWAPEGAYGQFYWHVKPIGVGRCIWSEIWGFYIEDTSRIMPPNTIEPPDGHTFMDENRIRFVWSSVQVATRYEFQISHNMDFSDTLEWRSTADTEFIWLVSDTGWLWWHVRAISGEMVSDWSNRSSFRIGFTDFASIPPILISPVDTSLFFANNVNFVWHSVRGAENYHIQVAEDSLFENLSLNIVIPDTFFAWPDITNGSFWWRVKSIAGNRESEWSYPSKFVISPYIVSTIPYIRSTSAIINNDWLFSVGDDGMFWIFGLSNPSQPDEITHFAWGASCQATSMALLNSTIIVPADICGIKFVDVSDPLNADVYTSRQMTNARKIGLDSDFGVVLTRENSFAIVDLSNIPSLTVHGPFPLPAQRRGQQVMLNGSIAYIAYLDGGILVADVSDWNNPRTLSVIPAPDSALTLLIDNNILYWGDKKGKLHIYDVSSPQSPSLMSTARISSSPITHIAKFEKYLLLAVPNEGIFAVDVSNPNSPITIGSMTFDGTPLNIFVEDSIASVSLGLNGLALIRLK